MYRPFAAAFLLALPLALSGAAKADAACIALLNWQDGSYLGYGSTGVKPGARLAERAIRPGCTDVIPSPPRPDRSVAVRRIQGIDPHVAIHDGHMTYVSGSTFPALRSHPLHARLGRKHLPWKTAIPCRIAGTAVVRYGQLGVEHDGEVALLRVRATTDVRLRRYGTGYVPAGAKIVVNGQRCARNGDQLWIDAKRIARG